MKRTLIYLTLALAAGVLFCQSQIVAAEGTTPVLPGILLNADDNGTERPAMVGDHILISLEDPYGRAYGWEVTEISGADALREIGHSQHMPGPGDWSWGQDTGQPDTAYFRFVAVAEGQTTVRLVCSPPPGVMAPTYLYEVTIIVAP